MKRALAVLAVAALLPVVPARAAGHLVTGTDVAAALQASAYSREQALARLDRVLATPDAARAAARAGVDAAALRAGLAALSDRELADLALRTAALEADPVAGSLDPTVRQLLIIFLVVAIVILVLQAVD